MNAKRGDSGTGFAAFVMTFNRPATLRATLTSLLAQTVPPEEILVIDNAASPATASVVASLDNAALSYQAMPENLGPAGAAAFGLQYFYARDFEWIYWGDDDDPPKTEDTLARLWKLAMQAPTDVGGIGAVGTRWNWRSGETVRLADDTLHGVLEVDTIAGSSQLLLHRRAIEKAGLPDRRLFFGFEEPEYCLRIRQSGLRLIVDGDLMKEYRALANRMNLPARKRFQLNRSYETLWRQYYATRNYIYVMQNRFTRPDLARREVMKATARSLIGWRYGIRFGIRLGYVQVRAIFDGFRGRVGRTILP